MHANMYQGIRNPDGSATVLADGAPFDPRPSQALWNHSPDGFEWGYGGSGPAQLALALLLDATADPARAARWHQDFKWAQVANWASNSYWQITRGDILTWLVEAINAERAGQHQHDMIEDVFNGSECLLSWDELRNGEGKRQ